jgi:beta-phosphoglucomutase
LIKACIFDLDGVIVDTAHYHFLAWKRLADELGIAFNAADNERLKGVSRMDSLNILLQIGAMTLNRSTKEQLADKKNTWFVEYIENMSPDEIFPGVKRLLKKLRSAGIKIAIASSSKNAKRVVELLKIKDDFDTIIDGNMIVNTKPDPEIFLLAASKIRIDPKDCVVFEDAEAGVEAALAAGMKCVGIGSVNQLNKANKIVMRIADFQYEDLRLLNGNK